MGQRGRPSKYKPELDEKVRELGRKGICVTEAGRMLGATPTAFRNWEARHPSFREAAKGVRKNSEAFARERFDRLLAKSEAQLLAALERLRQRRIDNAAKSENEITILEWRDERETL